ncbi:MAG: hypothetical protein M5U28_16465 [Sandaracinaceae bacterium]|nr:hypothetical protein [Sandaracinaceae bacterium]
MGSRWCCLALVALAACDGGELAIFVDVRTDYVPGVEFAEVRHELSSPRLDASSGVRTSVTSRASRGDDFIRGRRTGSLPIEGPGTYLLVTTLHAESGAVVASRATQVLVNEGRIVTVVISRNCQGVVCPGPGDPAGAFACHGGRCVPPTCTPEMPESCGGAQCGTDADCGARALCAEGLCLEGTCFSAPREGACPDRHYCDPDRGCALLPGEECQPEAEVCNGLDDDCDGVADDGFDLEADPMNCGACGRVCGASRTVTSACEAGECVLECEDGWADCDGDATDGCEVSLAGAEGVRQLREPLRRRDAALRARRGRRGELRLLVPRGHDALRRDLRRHGDEPRSLRRLRSTLCAAGRARRVRGRHLHDRRVQRRSRRLQRRARGRLRGRSLEPEHLRRVRCRVLALAPLLRAPERLVRVQQRLRGRRAGRRRDRRRLRRPALPAVRAGPALHGRRRLQREPALQRRRVRVVRRVRAGADGVGGVRHVRHAKPHVQRELRVGRVGHVQRRGRVRAGRDGVGRVRQLRHAEPHVHLELRVGSLRRVRRRGRVHTGRDGVGRVRQLRHTDADVHLELRVGCVRRVRRRGRVHTGRSADGRVRQLRDADAHVHLELRVGRVERVRRRGRVRAGLRRHGPLRQLRHGEPYVHRELHVGRLGLVHGRRRVRAGQRERLGLSWPVHGAHVQRELHVALGVHRVQQLVLERQRLWHRVHERLSPAVVRVLEQLRRLVLLEQPELLRADVRLELQPVRPRVRARLPPRVVQLRERVRRLVLLEQPEHLRDQLGHVQLVRHRLPERLAPESYSYASACGGSCCSNNQSTCAPNAGANFYTCGIGCPSGYAATSYSYASACGGSCCSNNRTYCTRI